MLAGRWEFWLLMAAIVMSLLYIAGPEENLIDFGAIKQEISAKMSSMTSKNTTDKPKSTSASTTKKEEGLLDKVLGLFDKDDKTSTKSMKNQKYDDLLNQSGELQRAVKDFKSANGDSLMIFQSFVIYPTHVSFIRQDPKNKENFDNYVWHENTGWNDPKPEKTPTSDQINKQAFDLTSFNFAMIPDLSKKALEEAKKQGVTDGKVGYMVIMRKGFREQDGDIIIQIPVEGSRKKVMVRADRNGTIYEVK